MTTINISQIAKIYYPKSISLTDKIATILKKYKNKFLYTVDEEVNSSEKLYLIPKNSVCFLLEENNLKYITRITKDCYSKIDMKVLMPSKSENLDFLYHIIKSIAEIVNINSTQSTFSIDDLLEYCLELPDDKNELKFREKIANSFQNRIDLNIKELINYEHFIGNIYDSIFNTTNKNNFVNYTNKSLRDLIEFTSVNDYNSKNKFLFYIENEEFFPDGIEYTTNIKSLENKNYKVFINASKDILDDYFLLVYLKSSYFEKYVKQNLMGENQNFLPTARLLEAYVKVPDLDFQKKLSKILEVLFDNLEALNETNIELQYLRKVAFNLESDKIEGELSE